MISPRDDERAAEDGGRFDLRCPECRSRWLAALVGRRSPARAGLVAAAVVLGMATGPAAAIDAPVPDREREGEAAPEGGAPAGDGDPAQDVEFDPGGMPLVLPEEQLPLVQPDPPAVGPPEDDGEELGGLEEEPVTDEEALIGDQETVEPPVEREPSPPATPEVAPVPIAPESVVPPGAPPPVPIPTTPEVTEPTTPRSDGREREPSRERSSRRSKPKERSASDPLPKVPALPRAAAPAGAQLAQVPPIEPVAEDPRGSDRAYVVRPGDTLWAIADRLLGGNASASKVARLVERLWRMNERRIGTGDPDVLLPGTRLRLP